MGLEGALNYLVCLILFADPRPHSKGDIALTAKHYEHSYRQKIIITITINTKSNYTICTHQYSIEKHGQLTNLKAPHQYIFIKHCIGKVNHLENEEDTNLFMVKQFR